MRVVLFRHGPAGKRDPKRWPDDADRPLTERGAARTRAAVRALARLEPGVGCILTSPLVRAEQTAKLLAQAYQGEVSVETLEDLAPGRPIRSVIARLGELGKDGRTVILVGHEPDLGRLAGVLSVGPQAAVPLKKAGACAIRLENGVRPGAGQLDWLLPPRFLRQHVRGVRKGKT